MVVGSNPAAYMMPWGTCSPSSLTVFHPQFPGEQNSAPCPHPCPHPCPGHYSLMSMKGNFLTIFFIFLKCLKKISEPHYIWLFFNANFIIFLLFYHFKSAPLCYGGLSLPGHAPLAGGAHGFKSRYMLSLIFLDPCLFAM